MYALHCAYPGMHLQRAPRHRFYMGWGSAANRSSGSPTIVHGMLRHPSVCLLLGCTVFIKMSLTVQKAQRLYEPVKILTFPVLMILWINRWVHSESLNPS
jgi:hypothetical protein